MINILNETVLSFSANAIKPNQAELIRSGLNLSRAFPGDLGEGGGGWEGAGMDWSLNIM